MTPPAGWLSYFDGQKNMKKLIPVLLAVAALLSLGSDSNVIRQSLVGDRILSASTNSGGALIAIDGKRLVEVRSDSENAVTIVVYGKEGEVLVASFLNDDRNPYSVHRTIYSDNGATAIVYEDDGSVRAQKFFPKEGSQ